MRIQKFLNKLDLRVFFSVAIALFLTASSLFGSSHREAPLISNDPLADNVDLYAFRSPDNPDMVTIIATYVPLQLPHGGPNYYSFGENVRYEIHIDNDASTTGDDIIYRFTFSKMNEDPTTFFNIRLGAQNMKTTYNLEKSTDGGATWSTVITNGIVPPPNIGPRSIESGVGLGSTYADLMADAITTASSGETVFCGTSDDPFFVDLGGIFDLGDAPRQGAQARDGLACYNVSTIAIQVPISMLQKDGKSADQATDILDGDFVIGVYATASRPMMRTLTAGGEDHAGDWVQVSRLGMPLTNEAVIPIGDKDRWNSTSPYSADEATFYAHFINPELALYMDDSQFGGAVPGFAPLRIQSNSLQLGLDFRNGKDGLFPLKGAPALAGTALDDAIFGNILLPAAASPRAVDLLPIFHTGVPNLRPYQLATGKGGDPLAAGKPFINNFLPNLGDMLRLNMAVPPTPRNSADFSSLGLIQAAVLGLLDPRFNANTDIQFIPNMDGFPNGRRLEDDVTRIELQAVGGAVLAAVGLWYDDYTAGDANPVTPDLLSVLGYTTGVETNDVAFQSSFPYVAMPWEGTSGCSGNPYSTTSADLELAVSSDKTSYNKFDNVTLTLTLTNKGPATARSVKVWVGLPNGTVFTRANASDGNYNLFFEEWNLTDLAVGETATLDLTVFALTNVGDINYFTQVVASSQNDIDSTPGNDDDQTADEDDEAAIFIAASTTVPDNNRAAFRSDLGASSAKSGISNVFPMPAKTEVTVEVISESDKKSTLQILNFSGQVLSEKTVRFQAGENQFPLPIANLPAGQYLINFSGETGKDWIQSFVKE